MKFIVTEADFPEEWLSFQNWENGPKMGQKQAVLELIEKIGDEFLQSLYYLVCSNVLG